MSEGNGGLNGPDYFTDLLDNEVAAYGEIMNQSLVFQSELDFVLLNDSQSNDGHHLHHGQTHQLINLGVLFIFAG